MTSFFLILSQSYLCNCWSRHFKFRVLIDTEEYECMRDILFPKGMCSESRDLFKFWKISDNISETVQDRHICNRRLMRNCMWMWPIEWHHCQCFWMTLKATFAVWNLYNCHSSWNIARIYQHSVSRGPSAVAELLEYTGRGHMLAMGWKTTL